MLLEVSACCASPTQHGRPTVVLLQLPVCLLQVAVMMARVMPATNSMAFKLLRRCCCCCCWCLFVCCRWQ
jgi:hypothetical protein